MGNGTSSFNYFGGSPNNMQQTPYIQPSYSMLPYQQALSYAPPHQIVPFQHAPGINAQFPSQQHQHPHQPSHIPFQQQPGQPQLSPDQRPAMTASTTFVGGSGNGVGVPQAH